MPHLAGKCDCGRNIHFPKTATLGYQWKCRQCGKVWILSNQGKPLHNQRSKAPPKDISFNYTSSNRQSKSRKTYVPSPKSSSNSSFGCSQIIGFAVIGFIVYVVLTVIN